jgi:hypothetical protein
LIEWQGFAPNVGGATAPERPKREFNLPQPDVSPDLRRPAGKEWLTISDTATLAEWITYASIPPARQPEAVAASLIGQRDPADRPASTHRLVPPALDQPQQCRGIRR